MQHMQSQLQAFYHSIGQRDVFIDTASLLNNNNMQGCRLLKTDGVSALFLVTGGRGNVATMQCST